MILITGQSRSGTSLMFMLFAINGVYTGYSAKGIDWLRSKLVTPDSQGPLYGRVSNGVPYALRGGGEYFHDHPEKVRRGEWPDVIKHPYGPTNRNPIMRLRGHGLEPEHVIITRRDVDAIIRSQANMLIQRNKWRNDSEAAIKRLTKPVTERYDELDKTFPDAIWVDFPRFIEDFDYLWGKVGHLLNEKLYAYTRREFESLIHPEFVRF